MSRFKILQMVAPLLVLLASCASHAVDQTAGTVSESLEALPRTEEVSYAEGGLPMRGYLARPAGDLRMTVPGILVVHEWWGHNDYAQSRARQLSDLGYVAFALDMYGDGKVADHPSSAGEFMSALMENEDAMRARFEAGLDLLRAQPGVDASQIGVVGYCMGGGIATRMAVLGADVNAVVSFHGSLPEVPEVAAQPVKADILLLNGLEDPFLGEAGPEAAVAAFEDKLSRLEGVNKMQSAFYAGAVHGFTNPAATEYNERFGMGGALGYNAAADAASWDAMKSFLAERLK